MVHVARRREQSTDVARYYRPVSVEGQIMSLVGICLLCGIVLGLRFTVIILAPITGLILAAIATQGIIANAALLHTFGIMILSMIALQFGYLFGGILRSLTFVRRAPAEPDSVTGAHSSGHLIN